jgi:hypothetical protein
MFKKNLAMRSGILLILVLLMVSVSCTKKYEKDYSLSIEEYQELGIPNPTRVWDPKDITNAGNALTELKWKNPYALPRKDSEKSGMLFRRMISLDNMTFLQDESNALNEKAYQILEFLSVFEGWIKLYNNPLWKKPYYHRELIEIYINGVNVTQKMLDIADKIQESNDPDDVMMQSGDAEIRINYVSSLLNVMKIQSNTSHFLEEDLEIMADSISISIERNKDWMDSIATNLLKQSMETVMDSTSSDYIKNKYRALSDLL